MATYNLIKRTSSSFITRASHDDKFVYKMIRISGEQNWSHVHSMDLRSDRLVIHGTEIKESELVKLHQSFILRGRNGRVIVNCNGACYFWVDGWVAPVHNVILDWSQFGVIVPDSMNDSLRKKLEQKEKVIDEMKHQLSSAETEASSTKAALDASKKEVEDLKEQLSACRRGQDDMEAKLKKACSQISLTAVGLESKKIELESSQKEVNELGDRLSACTKETQNSCVINFTQLILNCNLLQPSWSFLRKG